MAKNNQTPISVAAAAAVISITPCRVRQLLRKKVLSGRKLSDTVWMVDRDSAEHYRRNRPPVGRPRSQ